MSFENRLHKRIEEGNVEEKQKVLEKVNSQIEISGGTEARAVDRRRNLLLISALVGAFALFLLIFLIAFLGRGENKMRYCIASEYSLEETQQTLKDYSAEHEGKILFFDWYDVTTFHSSQVIVLNTTHEVICFMESLCDENSGNEVLISVTDDHTILDSLEFYESMCDSMESGTVTVRWGSGDFDSYAMFENQGYRYFLEIKDSNRPDLARDYALQLLNS